MLVIDNPNFYDRPFEGSTFVIISIDPAASVAELDDQARLEASQICPTKYLALMDDDIGFEVSQYTRVPKLRLDFCLACDGLPDAPLDWAATPISPAPAHPITGRAPISPSHPLPWPNVHLTSLVSSIAIVSRIYQHSIPGPSLGRPQRNLFMRSVRADNKAYEPDEEHATYAEYEDALAELRAEMRELEEDVGADEDDADAMFDIIGQDYTPQMRLHVQLWVDLQSVERPGNPANLRSEIRRLKEIEWNWAQRVVAEALAKKPETSAWLEGISGADTPSVEIAGEAVEDEDGDMSIVPEDAIEHRAERLAELDETPEEAATLSLTRALSDLVPSPAMSAVTTSMRSTSSSLSVRSDNSPGTSFRLSIVGFLGGFLTTFSRIAPYASRFRSLFLTWIWRPFAR